MYYLFYGFVWLLSRLPLRALYALSDCLLYPVMRYVLRYRVKLVRHNLSLSFPDKDMRWVNTTANRFYHYLCDEFVECIKMLTISEDEMRRRIRFENTEEVQGVLDSGRNVTLMLGHLGNWDWVASIPLWFKDNFFPGQIYHPLENEAADKVFLKIRGRWGARNIAMAQTLRVLIEYGNSGRPWMVGFIADQVPLWKNIHHWLNFLNHVDTPVFTGAERLSRKFSAAVYYLEIRRERRGYYVVRFVPMYDDCTHCSDFEVTDRFFAMLEQNIRKQPHLWLWSHNRWKRTKEEYLKRVATKTL